LFSGLRPFVCSQIVFYGCFSVLSVRRLLFYFVTKCIELFFTLNFVLQIYEQKIVLCNTKYYIFLKKFHEKLYYTDLLLFMSSTFFEIYFYKHVHINDCMFKPTNKQFGNG